MNCEPCREHLAELFYGDLDDATAAEVRAHLEMCETCRAERATLEQTIGVLDAWGPVEAAGDAGLVAARAIASPRPRRGSIARLVPWAGGLAAGFTLALVVSAFFITAQRERVLDEIARERQLTLVTIEGALQEWAAEQDLQHDSLVRTFEDARAQDLEYVAGAINQVIQMVKLDRTEIEP